MFEQLGFVPLNANQCHFYPKTKICNDAKRFQSHSQPLFRALPRWRILPSTLPSARSCSATSKLAWYLSLSLDLDILLDLDIDIGSPSCVSANSAGVQEAYEENPRQIVSPEHPRRPMGGRCPASRRRLFLHQGVGSLRVRQRHCLRRLLRLLLRREIQLPREGVRQKRALERGGAAPERSGLQKEASQ